MDLESNQRRYEAAPLGCGFEEFWQCCGAGSGGPTTRLPPGTGAVIRNYGSGSGSSPYPSALLLPLTLLLPLPFGPTPRNS